ncbi:glycoside hydrolase family 36 protein [Allostreptomyces psammosilenae]|uniref:Alpha-galactosidase n=1 Tax=Allostreptomyces psammosilenae TaxID=1892865 RepID=A0A853A8K4_9ACTN|nr:glycoside hydrolase family 36 protein [Allostreptomyces psammosilenae]NYI06762.1 alpha-galactosidase [Allostreptomyces psammosilenae]
MSPDTTLTWSGSDVTLTLTTGGDRPVGLVSLRPAGTPAPPPADPAAVAPLVEVMALGHGRFPGSHRYADTTVGARLRYTGHHTDHRGGVAELRVTQLDEATGLVATSVFQASDGAPAVRCWTELTVRGEGSVRLLAVTSLATGAFLADSGRTVDDLDVVHGDSDWVVESRWHRTPLREAGLPQMDPVAHHHPSRSRFALTSRSSWSTGEHLPTGALVARDDGWACAWQIEHNGAWHWEVGERQVGAYLALLGPTDAEHQWSTVVTARDGFRTVPVSVAVCAGGLDDALAALTLQRRALLVPRPSRALPVIFNDYMNTLMGDPTTEKLLPLVDAAAAAGADYFCVDAGWYDEDGRWWDSVGEWRPSRTRFPGPRGLAEVTDRIRERGMVPGIWLEPEVIGVRSPMAAALPIEAFFQRHGERVVEHGRYHLDLRHPRARAHLDEVVDRLVEEFGVGYFKLDYNIMPGPGTDLGGLAPGEGLLAHNRAHLEWLDALLRRHPGLLIENCASGAMRMDYAMMSRLHIQSTSDQQNPLLYPPIAAAAPASLLPEQAGNWAYTQPEMSVEESAFTLATGVLGRLYLSGYLNRMEPGQLALVREAVEVHKGLRDAVASSVPFWPLGLTGPAGPWVAQGLRDPRGRGDSLLTVWRRPGAADVLELPVAHLRGAEVDVEVLFPRAAPDWAFDWRSDTGVLRLSCSSGAVPTARVLRLRRRA